MRNEIVAGVLVFGALMGNAYAADTDVCPKVADIKSSPYTSTDPQIPSPYNEGYSYTATSTDGKKWTGVTMATSDDYLASKYNLKAEHVHVKGKNTICSYGGTKVVENGETADPYLKLLSAN